MVFKAGKRIESATRDDLVCSFSLARHPRVRARLVRWQTQFDPLAQSHNAANGTGGGADRKTAARFRMPTRAASRLPCPVCPYTRPVASLAHEYSRARARAYVHAPLRKGIPLGPKFRSSKIRLIVWWIGIFNFEQVHILVQKSWNRHIVINI